MQQVMSGLCARHVQYHYISSSRERLGFYAEILIIFGAVHTHHENRKLCTVLTVQYVQTVRLKSVKKNH